MKFSSQFDIYLIELAEDSIEGRSFNVKTPSVGFLSPNNFQIHLNKRAFALVHI